MGNSNAGASARVGRALGLDVGSVRIGVAVSDPDRILATPVETIAADKPARGGRAYGLSGADRLDVNRVLDVALDYDVSDIVIGLPITLRGNDTESTTRAREFSAALQELLAQENEPMVIHLVDERMSTMAATQAMRASGVNAKKSRSRIDQAAAVHILQGWLDQRRERD